MAIRMVKQKTNNENPEKNRDENKKTIRKVIRQDKDPENNSNKGMGMTNILRVIRMVKRQQKMQCLEVNLNPDKDNPDKEVKVNPNKSNRIIRMVIRMLYVICNSVKVKARVKDKDREECKVFLI